VAEIPQDEAPGDRPHPSKLDWSRAQAEHARAKADEARQWAEEARGRSRLVALAFDLAERDRTRLGGLLAGAVAYRLFLWLLPFSLLLVGVLGAVTSLDDGAPNDLSTMVGLKGFIGSTLSGGARQRGWWIAILVGLFGALYAGMGAVRALRISHAAAWGILPERGWNPLKGSLWLMAIAVGLLAISGLIGWVRTASPIGGLVALVAMLATYFAVWLLASSKLPHKGTSLRALAPGAALVAVGMQSLHLFTVYYLAGKAARAASLYGTIGAALTLLLWLFIIARLLVGAATLNAELAAHDNEAREPS
jgi:uncharacterized BrkB/YihY/UPF0761 family membrane protein